MIVPVRLGSSGYDVHVAPSLVGLGGAVAGLGAARAVIATDEVVAPLWAAAVGAELRRAGLEVAVVAGPAGEAHKDVHTWWRLVDGLLRAGVDRRSVVVALGGGVVGDLVGFAAASVLRGVRLVQVPTTLLAMVDSSVGGKTGFNHPLGKNLVGAFHQPSLVWAPMEVLSTLPSRELRSGLGEVLKHALLDGEAALDGLERAALGATTEVPEALAELVAASVTLKASVVQADEREAGLREVLNLGHTVGHAVEAVAGYGEWLHGEAVAIGLVAELRATARRGWTDAALPERVATLARRLGLPADLPPLPSDALVEAMRVDKKARGAMVMVPVCRSPGTVERTPWSVDRLQELLR